MWRVAQKMHAQVRLSPDGRLIGLDMGACLSLARASGVCERAAAQFFPIIEAAMVKKASEVQNVD